jgi:AraC family transcriptional regulator, transcriptional activator of pobA
MFEARVTADKGRSLAVTGRSLEKEREGAEGAARKLDRRAGGPPVYTYERLPGVPPVSIMRLDRESLGDLESDEAHSHDFLVLAYFERGGGSLRIGARQWRVKAGDAYVIAPGEIAGAGHDPGGLANAEGWAVYFPPESLGPSATDAVLAWRAHPLLFPFARGAASGAQRLTVPASEQREWSQLLAALERELRERHDGYQQAAVARLTLLLVGASRLAADVGGDLRLKDEPLLAEVFDLIEARYHEPISLRDVAAAVNLSPAHLTTTVRRKTGRTVQEWISERRMAQARRLLAATDLTVDEIARNVGYADSAYFVRCFRRDHATTPLRWRRAGRP